MSVARLNTCADLTQGCSMMHQAKALKVLPNCGILLVLSQFWQSPVTELIILAVTCD